MVKGKLLCEKCNRYRPIGVFSIIRNERNAYGKYCKECSIPDDKTTYNRKRAKQYRDNKRSKVFNHYGTYCAYCGGIDDLQIDHIFGDGNQHRKSVKDLYAWLIKNNYPTGFQTLCKKHNMMKSYFSDSEFRALLDSAYAYIHRND